MKKRKRNFFNVSSFGREEKNISFFRFVFLLGNVFGRFIIGFDNIIKGME